MQESDFLDKTEPLVTISIRRYNEMLKLIKPVDNVISMEEMSDAIWCIIDSFTTKRDTITSFMKETGIVINISQGASSQKKYIEITKPKTN